MTVNEVDDRGVSCLWIEDGRLCEAEFINSEALHTEPVEALVGDFFLSLKDGVIDLQGQVLAWVSDEIYEVELFSWIHGEPIERRIASLDQMENWRFYGDVEQLRTAYLAARKGETS